jgi:hypothetical protein
MNWKGCLRSSCGLNWGYYPRICLEGLRRTLKGFSGDGRYPGQDSNWMPLEYTQAFFYARLFYASLRHHLISTLSVVVWHCLAGLFALIWGIFFGVFCIQMPQWYTQWRDKNTDMKMNNHSSNFNSSNMYDLWITKWLCESESESLWQSICDGDGMESLPSMRA